MDLKALKEAFKKALMNARAIAAKAEEENRDFTGDEREQVRKFMEEAGTLKKQIKEAEGDAALRKELEALGADIDLNTDDGQPGQQPAGRPGRGKSIGQQFVESRSWVDWMKQVAPGGRIPDSTRGLVSPPVQFKSLMRDLRAKTLVTGDDDESAGAFVVPDYTGIYEPLGRYPLTVRDLISVRTTTSDLVHFVRQTAKVTEAEVVPEANVTTYSGATGEVSGEKPEGAIEFEAVTTPVKTIAVWIPATKRALSDAAQLRGIIDDELRADLDEELEDQIINGDGTGDDFTGILSTSGLLTFAWDTDLLTTIRKARTYLQVAGRSRATAMLVHPYDAETMDLLQDDQGRFYFQGPAQGGVQTVWRVPIVESETMTQGTGLMGDFRKAVLWDREEASITVSDSHSDFFIRNMIAILAELRAAFGVIRPTAFCEVDLESGS